MAEGTTLEDVLRRARERLAAAGLDDPALEARILVEHLTGTTRSEALADPRRFVAAGTVERIEVALARREKGEPVYRIIGRRDFYGLELMLSPETLEPRPDTETLVDAVLPAAREMARHGVCRILDLGTGTGAIALALLSQIENCEATGTDKAPGALATARRNAEDNGLSARFKTLESDWFDAISGRFHLIVSNPPYIETKAIQDLQPEVRNFDPLLALDGGVDGLVPYRIIAERAADFLEPEGIVGVETGFDQKTSVTDIFETAGYRLIEARRDLAGSDRALVFKAQAKL